MGFRASGFQGSRFGVHGFRVQGTSLLVLPHRFKLETLKPEPKPGFRMPSEHAALRARHPRHVRSCGKVPASVKYTNQLGV